MQAAEYTFCPGELVIVAVLKYLFVSDNKDPVGPADGQVREGRLYHVRVVSVRGVMHKLRHRGANRPPHPGGLR